MKVESLEIYTDGRNEHQRLLLTHNPLGYCALRLFLFGKNKRKINWVIDRFEDSSI